MTSESPSPAPPRASPGPRRILMVSRSLPPHVAGGLEFHTVELAAALAERGVEVDLLSTSVPQTYVDELAGRGVRLHALAGVPPGRYSLNYFRKIGRRVDDLHRERAYDVIHGHEFAFGFADPRRWGAPAVLSVHGTITSETPLHHDVFAHLPLSRRAAALARFGRRWLFAPSWSRALDRSTLLLVDSDFTRTELERIRPAVLPRVRKAPLAVDESAWPELDRPAAREALGWPPSGRGAPVYVVTMGRLEWQKGHEPAMRALAGLKRENWRYIIAGEGSQAARLRRLAEELGIADRVEFTGRVTHEVRARLLAAADLFLWPERTHPAFGLVGLESMLMGTPVAASRRGAIPEALGGRGWLFDPEDPSSISTALEPLLASPDSLIQARAGLREFAMSRFSIDRMAAAVMKAYAEAMANYRA